MNYFSSISKRCDELSDIAQSYLDTLPYITPHDASERIWKWAWSQVETDERDNVIWPTDGWEVDSVDKTDLAYQIIDGGIPWSSPPNNGSLHYSLGWSIVAQEANLRMLLEYTEGRISELNYFQALAELPE